MENTNAPSTDGFGFFAPEQINPELTLKSADDQSSAALRPPLIVCHHKIDDRYFEFGTLMDNMLIIPREIIGVHPFRDSITTWISLSSSEVQIGDQMRVDWTPMDGSPEFRSEPETVASNEGYMRVAIPDSELIRFEGKRVEVIYVHLPKQGGAEPSPSRYVHVAPALGDKPYVKVKAVVDGVLDTSAYPNGVEVSIGPIEKMCDYNAIEVVWTVDGYCPERLRGMTVNPQQAMSFHIDPVVYKPYVGKRVTVYYLIHLGAGLNSYFIWTVSSGAVSFELS
jgi:hypothetical protein